MSGEDPRLAIARLEARVARLEKALKERSRVLRSLGRGACDEDVEALSRLASGRPLLLRTNVGAAGWRETRLVAAEVEQTMKALWRSIAPYDVPAEE